RHLIDADRPVSARGSHVTRREAVEHRGKIAVSAEQFRPLTNVVSNAGARVEQHDGGEWSRAGRLIQLTEDGAGARLGGKRRVRDGATRKQEPERDGETEADQLYQPIARA